MIDANEIREALEELDVDIPLCRDCNEEILFFKKADGKWAVVNLDFEPHFNTCTAKRGRR